MGLSAAQARLLTITSRKSDCEFQSMRYSHEKIALSRSMSDVSAEYQRALEQTKLVFDYYGSGDQSTPVSYGLFMTPSQANGFLPILTTNAQNRIVLSSPFAAAARAAGIPEEGLSSLPSTTVRNKFLDALGANNIITETQANTYKVIPYSQTIGMGTQDLVVTNMKTVNFNDLLTMLGDYSVKLPTSASNYIASEVSGSKGGKTVSLNDLYTNQIYVAYYSNTNNNYDDEDHWRYNYNSKDIAIAKDLQSGSNSFLLGIQDAMYSIFGNALDQNISEAIEYAYTNVYNIVNNATTTIDEHGGSNFGYYQDEWVGNGGADGDYLYSNGQGKQGSTSYDSDDHNKSINAWLKEETPKYLGFVGFNARGKYGRSGAGISYTNLYKAFLTYFAEKYEFLTYGGTGYVATEGNTASISRKDDDDNYRKQDSGGYRLSNKLIDSKFSVDVETAIGINSDEALLSGYWDALLNNLCAYGWTENNNVTNNEYLQEMYKSGRLFISTCTDDGYYYQTSYSTLSSVREITDEEAATKAEAKYNAEKQKINHKEQIIDMKMKNLDTEISSLSSEYETIKGLLSKNIERSFTRYKA